MTLIHSPSSLAPLNRQGGSAGGEISTLVVLVSIEDGSEALKRAILHAPDGDLEMLGQGAGIAERGTSQQEEVDEH